jgi:hypothetical protein
MGASRAVGAAPIGYANKSGKIKTLAANSDAIVTSMQSILGVILGR